MRKVEELSNPESCTAAALPAEMMFVLLARDAAAPDAIRHWAWRRVELGLNRAGDEQTALAYRTADEMDAERGAVRKELGKP
jgi:hypothetical protein